MRKDVQAILETPPRPLDTLYYKGLIDADPRRVHSKQCLQDAADAEALAWIYFKP